MPARLSGLLLLACAGLAGGVTGEPTVLAPAYTGLGYPAPEAGSYALPPIGEAADARVVDSRGRPESLHGLYSGHIVLLSFIYTACDDVNGCPLATSVLYRVGRAAAADPELAARLRLLSLSFDPRDTPEVLRRHAAGLAAGPPDWRFLTTDSQEALAPILEAYHQAVLPERASDGGTTGRISHPLRVLLIDPARRIRNVYSAAYLHPDVVLNDVRTLLREEGGGPVPGANDAGPPAEVPEVEPLAAPQRPPRGLPPLPWDGQDQPDAARVALGRSLFLDRRLSANGTLSCAMCHIPEQGFTSNELATPVGIEGRSVRRNAPTLYNVAYARLLFHDGRENRLEQQVWLPLLARNEMGNPSIASVLDRIAALPDYAGRFQAAFAGRGPSMETLGSALASYERVLLSANSAFDRWRYAGQADALGPAARHGYELFTGGAGCARCHRIGPEYALFTDQGTHNTGIGYRASLASADSTTRVELAPGLRIPLASALLRAVGARRAEDLGRYEVTLDPAERWAYKTPTLRNIALTAPYMHDGSIATLRGVVERYNRGGVANPLLDPLIRPLGLGPTEVEALVAFLSSLTGDNVAALIADARSAPVGDPGRLAARRP